MRPTTSSTDVHCESRFYEISIKGHLDNRWADWFEGMTITLDDDGNTRLSGSVVDQAALYGVLRKVRDFGMPLLSVNCDEIYQNRSKTRRTNDDYQK